MGFAKWCSKYPWYGLTIFYTGCSIEFFFNNLSNIVLKELHTFIKFAVACKNTFKKITFIHPTAELFQMPACAT